jgi:hypothetical protein
MAPETMYCEGEQLRFPTAEFTQKKGGYVHNVPGNPHWAATGEPLDTPGWINMPLPCPAAPSPSPERDAEGESS